MEYVRPSGGSTMGTGHGPGLGILVAGLTITVFREPGRPHTAFAGSMSPRTVVF